MQKDFCNSIPPEQTLAGTTRTSASGQSLHFAPQKNNELFAVSDESRHSTLCCREREKSLVICATSNIMAWSPLMVAGSS